MIADSLNILVAVRDGASVSGTNDGDGSAGASSAAFPFVILSRVGEIERRVFVKGGFCLVMLFYVVVYFGISFALSGRDGCRRVVHVTLHARTTTIMIA